MSAAKLTGDEPIGISWDATLTPPNRSRIDHCGGFVQAGLAVVRTTMPFCAGSEPNNLGSSEAISTGMAALLTSPWRPRAAAILAVLYALCLLAPVGAFAFSAAPAHCLTIAEDHHHGMGETQAHQDGIGHHKPSPEKSGPATDEPGKCCGLFCVTALAPPAFGVADMQTVAASAVAIPAAESLLGRSSNRIDRPPRLLPSL